MNKSEKREIDAQYDLNALVQYKLRQDGRASFTQIAKELAVPRNQVASIVQKMLAEGTFRITASLSPDLLGVEKFAYMQLKVESQFAAVRSKLQSMPETTFVADITGTYNLDAEVRVGPDPHLRKTIDAIKHLSGVSSARIHLYESIEINEHSPIRTGSASFRIDDADREVIRVLQRDGRASLQDLAEAACISPSGARLKLQRLIESGALKIVGIPIRSDQHTSLSLGVGVTVQGSVQEALVKIRSLRPEFMAVTFGTFDLIITLAAETNESLVLMLERLRAISCVTDVESWANLRIVKEQYGEGDQLVPTADISGNVAQKDNLPLGQ